MSAPPDVVYLCREGENEELRYSLRSLVNLEHRGVHVVGGVPRWYSGPRIAVRPAGDKHVATDRALRAAVESDAVSDPFVLFNDDFYVMHPGGPVEPRHRGPIRDLVVRLEGELGQRSRWTAGMLRTAMLLEDLNLSTLSYELHLPILVHKEPMLRTLELTAMYGGQKRSVYGNLAGLGGALSDDVKVYRAGMPLPVGRWLSTSDFGFQHVQGLLMTRFDRPSEWETR